MKKDPVGLARLKFALSNSTLGLMDALSTEKAFRLESLAAAAAIPLAVVFGDGAVERSLLIGSLLLLMIVELVNSAIEAAVDRIGPEWHVLSRKAKDFGSAAVLLSIVLAVMVWGLIIFENLREIDVAARTPEVETAR